MAAAKSIGEMMLFRAYSRASNKSGGLGNVHTGTSNVITRMLTAVHVVMVLQERLATVSAAKIFVCKNHPLDYRF
jgi:hypothetical protein